MMVLSRRRGEQIVIDGGKVIITILACDNGKVRLGFDADKDILIDRMEIHEQRNQKEGYDGK